MNALDSQLAYFAVRKIYVIRLISDHIGTNTMKETLIFFITCLEQDKNKIYNHYIYFSLDCGSIIFNIFFSSLSLCFSLLLDDS